MPEPQHILLVSPGFPAHEEDFLCIPPLQAFAEGLHGRGYQVTVIALHYPYEKAQYSWKGIPVHALGGNNKGFPWRLSLWNAAGRGFKKLHQARPVDLVHSFWVHECTYLAGLWASDAGLPHIATLMGQEMRNRNVYLGRTNLKRIRVTALSKRIAEQFKAKTGLVAEAILPWGIDQIGKAGQVRERAIDLLGVGSLIPLKRYELFLEVVAGLVKERPDLKAVLIGEGPERKKLEPLIRSQNLDRNLSLAGLLPRPEVMDYMARSRVFYHPSMFESQGYVFYEALAQGMHVVSGPVGVAEAGPRWKLAPDTPGAIEACGQLLGEQAPSHDPYIPLDMEATLDAYTALYRS